MKRALVAAALTLTLFVPAVFGEDSFACVRLTSTLKFRSVGAEVTLLQKFLRDRGYPIPMSGLFDNVTQVVLRDWQRVQKLAISGKTDDATRARIASVSCGETVAPPAVPSGPSSGGNASSRSPRSLGRRMPIIRVLSPNGGERWEAGSFQTIRWSSANVTAVSILLARGSATTPGNPRWEMLADRIPNTGSITWSLPLDLPAGREYMVRIVDADTLIGDESNTVFTVASDKASDVRVLSPNGGERLVAGDRTLIRWAVSSQDVKEVEVYVLDASRTADRMQLVARTPNYGGYIWKVPFRIGTLDLTGTTAANYKILIRALRADGSTEDVSDAGFAVAPKVAASPRESSLAPPSILITSPFSGQRVPRGKTFAVRWSSNGVEKVFLRLSKGGKLYEGSDATLSEVILNTGTFDWTVPLTLPDGNDYTLRVQDIDGKAIGEIPFTVVPAS